MTDHQTTNLGKMLRRHREIEERTLRSLAREIGTSYSTLARIESGKPCDVPTLLKLLAWMQKPFGGTPRV